MPPKSHFLGREYAFSSQTRQIRKHAYYRNYCIDSNQILHNDKDQKMLFMRRQNPRTTNSTWRTAAILNMEKLRYFGNGMTDFDEIWHGDTSRSAPCQPIKYPDF